MTPRRKREKAQAGPASALPGEAPSAEKPPEPPPPSVPSAATAATAPASEEVAPPPLSVSPVPQAAPAPTAENYLEVARAAGAVIFRPRGLGNMKVALGLMDFATEMLRQGYVRFLFDMGCCRGLDSTFMGAMVGLAAAAQEAGGSALVVNADQANLELLQIVGADRFLQMRGRYPMEDLETERLDPPPPSAERRLELVRKAHENLVVIDKRNEARFGAFLRQLSTELGRKAED